MAQQTINVGAAPNDGTGTPLRTAFQYTNANFTELYTALGGGTGLPGASTQVLFNNGTNIAGDAGLTYNAATDALTVGGLLTAASASITGDLTVDTSTLKVDSANNLVGIGTTAMSSYPVAPNLVVATSTSGGITVRSSSTGYGGVYFADGTTGTEQYRGFIQYSHNSGGVVDSLLFGSSGATNMALDSSGNLGLGVTPSAWGSSFKAMQIGTGGAVWASTSATEVNIGGNTRVDANNAQYDYINNGAASQYQQSSGKHMWFTAGSGTAGNAITFTQAMTLDASGNLLVGTTGLPGANGRISAKSSSSSLVPLRAFCDANDASPTVAFDKSSATNTTSQVFAIFTISNQSVGSGQINANGANQAAFGSFSDSRLKENIASLPSQLANILSLNPVEFDYKDGSGHQIGFVAQEMQKVYSDAVGEQNGFLTVTGWSKTEARLVSAIKELAAKIQSLEAKLA